MRQRCNNPNAPKYKNYGKRGIDVCKEWDSFEEFSTWALKNGYKDDLTIERIDVHLGYSPENCIWISKKEQQMNKTTSRYLEYNGQRLTVTQWAERLGINVGTIKSRVHRGWSIEEILTRKVNERRSFAEPQRSQSNS